MIRPLALLTLLALSPMPAAAQQPLTIALTAQPMASPVPALRYRLLPDLRELKYGNAVQLYYRAFSPEWQSFRRDPKFLIKVGELVSKPLRELRPADLDEFSWLPHSGMMKELDRAARRSYCEWELIDRMREDGIGLLLPDLQSMREFANLLRLQALQELHGGQYAKAAHTLQTGLAMSRHIAEGPTLIHDLVGIAIANQMFRVVDDWIERPDAPNLYWALTYLPNPLIDLSNGLQGERLTIDNLFPDYREMLADLSAPPSSAQLQTTLKSYGGILAYGNRPQVNTALVATMRAYPEAKRFLRQQGRTAEQVEAMPALQAVFLYEVHQYDVFYDDMLKWTRLPYHEAAPKVRSVVKRFASEDGPASRSSMAMLLLPAIEKVLEVPVRLERKIAALRCIEALRLYAAAHAGKLPTRLEDVTAVPIPLDPWTGKAFTYRLEDGKATLAGGPLGKEMPSPQNSLRYELTLRPAKGQKEEKKDAPPADAKAEPTEQGHALASIIDEETFALVRIDVSHADVEGLTKTLLPLLPRYKEELAEFAKKVKEFQAAFTKAGGTELTIVFSTADLPGPAFLHVPLKEGADVAALTGSLKEWLPERDVAQKHGKALVAGSRAALARLAKSTPSPRAELAPALAAAGDSAVQVLLLPTQDQRRVVEEVATVPVPGGLARALTQGVRWAALGLDVGPKPAFKLTLHAANDAAAKKMVEMINAGFTLLGQETFPSEVKILRDLFPKEFAATTEALKPVAAGKQVTIQLGDPAALAAISALVMGIEDYRGGGVQSEAGQHLKQILIAMHNFADANNALPAHAIYSKEGKPLLSWRVALLPYLEQGPLYGEFHLDEPWDSPHNKKLIARIPKAYRSPKIKDKRPGLTTYLAPINKAFVFTGTSKGLQFKDIQDGTSNTAILVDVADEAGVIWTKPDDLVVNEKEPRKGLFGHYPNYVLMGMADGSVQRVGKKVADKTLWALFTRDGGEVLPDLSK